MCRNSRHFARSAIDFVQCFPLHLQLLLRILLEHLRVAPKEHLANPFVGFAAGTEPCCLAGTQVIQPEMRTPSSLQGLSPGRPHWTLRRGFWGRHASTSEFPLHPCDFGISFVSGNGGTIAMLMPNGATFYIFSDGIEFSSALLAAKSISSHPIGR
jgi:hypothetical protein